MSEVTLQVGGRPYTLSCADGEEEHVRRLAAVVNGKLAALGTNMAPGDAKNLLFAALILADEVEESRRATVLSDTPLLDDSVLRGLEMLAQRLESVAAALENPAASP